MAEGFLATDGLQAVTEGRQHLAVLHRGFAGNEKMEPTPSPTEASPASRHVRLPGDAVGHQNRIEHDQR
jgi:hypothetical protein